MSDVLEGAIDCDVHPGVPASARPDWRRGNIRAAETVDVVREDVLDRWSLEGAILNCLYGVQQIHDERLAAALCKAVNDWLAEHWLDKEPRLAASIEPGARVAEGPFVAETFEVKVEDDYVVIEIL